MYTAPSVGILEMMSDWKELLKSAYSKALESIDPSTQNGAILVNRLGNIILAAVNAFPAGIAETPERQEKPLRYTFRVHAERNLIYQAAKMNIETDGLTMVCCWAPCTDCAQAIIQSGIKRLVTHQQALERSGGWRGNIELALEMLHEAGVEVIIYNGRIGAEKVLRDGIYWEP